MYCYVNHGSDRHSLPRDSVANKRSAIVFKDQDMICIVLETDELLALKLKSI